MPRTVKRSVVQIAPLAFRASLSPASLDEDKRTVDLVWTTGARVLRGYYDQFWEELSLDPKHVRMERLNGGAPLLDAHNGGDLAGVIGVVESARLDKGKGTATVRFAKAEDDPNADAIFRKVKDGIIRNVSVGYRINKMEKVSEEEGKVPVYRAVDWTPHEISIVPIGADAGAGVRSSDQVTTNPCEFIEERDMPDPEKPITTPAPQPVLQVTAEQRAEIANAERARISGIERIGTTLKRSPAEIRAAIDGGVSLDKFRTDAVDALANAPAEDGGVIAIDKRDPRIQAGADQRDKIMQRNENWLVLRAGLGEMFQNAAKRRGQTLDLDPGESRGMTLVEMARDSLERAGVKTRGMDVMKMIGLAFTHRGGGGNSTSDFPILLENVQHKTLLSAYATTPDTWRDWCVVGSVTDFRAHNRYRQGSLGVFDDLPEGAEYKQASIPDAEKQSITAGTKGRMITITRQVIINDDMSALTDLATRMGRAASLTIEVAAYARLLENAGAGPTMSDGNPLFHAAHGNIGAGAAISVASIDADRVLMGQQQDPSKNEYIELRPAILLLPIGLGGQANVINKAQFDTDKVANARNQEPNKVVGLYRKIVDTARLTGTARYSFADPAIAPCMEVAFLNGQQEPYLEMMQGWLVDGVQWKARLDFGTAARDWRGAVKNAGV